MFLLIDKPKGITSHDVVDRVRRITGIKKVGHAGTLDPNAIGLLIVGVGRDATRHLGKISKDTTKVYEAEIFLGEERDTDDVEGNKLPVTKYQAPIEHKPTRDQISDTLETFTGEQEQIPPAYSAIKLQGKKAYEIARKGGVPNLEPRKITIHSIKLVDYEYPILRVETEVSSGTYIRSLARDIGRALGCGAYLNNLRRTKIGKWSIKKAVGLEDLTKENWKEHLIAISV